MTSCSGDSTPSATTLSPSDWPSRTTASTIEVSSASMPSPATNDRSILIASIGKRFRYVSDE